MQHRNKLKEKQLAKQRKELSEKEASKHKEDKRKRLHEQKRR